MKRQVWYLIDLHDEKLVDSYESLKKAEVAAERLLRKSDHTSAIALGKYFYQQISAQK